MNSALTRAAATITALAGLLALPACGSEERQDAGIEPGEYSVNVSGAYLEPVQRLAKTTMMRIAVENTGAETIPNLAVTIKVEGPEGEDARQAFAYRDPQENLAVHDRPIWILDLGYPVLAGDETLGASVSASPRTFQFGRLPAGRTARAAWRITPVKAGSYRVSYEIAADLHGVGEITDRTGSLPAGRLPVRILEQPQRLRVTGDGRVVPIGADRRERPRSAPNLTE